MDDTKAFITFNGFDGCDTLYSGVTTEFLIMNFPAWFDTSKAFSVKYSDFSDTQSLDITAGVRFTTEKIPSEIPDEYSSSGLCQTFLGTELGCADIKAWIGTYSSKPAIILSGEVTSGKIDLCGDSFSISQNEQQITEFSYWPNNNTTAGFEYINLCKEITEGTSFQGAIFSLPSWFDINQPFVFSIGSVEFNFPPESSSCAAETALGSGQPELDTLRKFRDETLSKTQVGQKVVELFYKHSPAIVKTMGNNPMLKASARHFFKACAAVIEKFN